MSSNDFEVTSRYAPQENDLPVRKTNPDAKLPTYATDGSAALDLCAAEIDMRDLYSGSITIDTGLAFAVPEGYGLLILSRSGAGFRHNIRLANCVGLIDSDYRGTVKVKLRHDARGPALADYMVGDRVAQVMLVPMPRVRLVEVDSLPETERGEGGFGSTGR